MTFNTLKQSLYGLYLTNSFGYKLSKTTDPIEKKSLRLCYSHTQLKSLNITISVEDEDKIPSQGQYLVVINHRSIIDPPILEIALENSHIFGPWISKKELYNSFFFGLFVRHAGSILLDREKNQMLGFFAEIKQAVNRGESILIFPEGTRNKTDKILTPFKDGSRIIALKNRLPILPIYIKTDSSEVLRHALKNPKLKQTIVVSIGDIIAYRDKTDLEENYRKIFSL